MRITAQLIDAEPARISGPIASTARSKTSSSSRTRSRSASPASSNRHCKRPRLPVPPAGRPMISRPMTSICVPMQCSGLRQGKLPRRSRLMEQAIARRSALRTRPRLGRVLLLSARDGRPEPKSSGGPSKGHGFRPGGRWRWPATIPARPGERRRSVGLFRRGHRRYDRVGRSALELNPNFAHGWFISSVLRAVGWPARPRDRARRGLVASQPSRPR